MYLAGKLAALESLRGGFTTVVDAGTRAEGDLDPLVQAVTDAGLHCVLGMICNDRGGAPSLGPHEILKRAEVHLAKWPGGGLIHPSLAISIPEAASDEMLYSVASLCHEAGVAGLAYSIHSSLAFDKSASILLINSSAALYPCCLKYQLLAAASISPATSRPG